MDEHTLSTLLQTPLLQGIPRGELPGLLAHLQANESAYTAGEALLLSGDVPREIGIVLAGEIEAHKLTAAGSQFTVARMEVGGIFGDVLSGGEAKSPVTVVALTPCRVLYLSYPRLFLPPAGEQPAYTLLLQNLIRVISGKYFALDERLDLLLTQGLRRRISVWLLGEAARRGSNAFTVAHSRASLAAYLGCERSALSRELSRMAKEGLIETRKGFFRLVRSEQLRRAAAE